VSNLSNLLMENQLRAMGHHMPYGITQATLGLQPLETFGNYHSMFTGRNPVCRPAHSTSSKN